MSISCASNSTIVVWDTIRAGHHVDLLDHYLPMCPEGTKKRIEGFSNWQQVQAFVLGRALLAKGIELSGNRSLTLDSIKLSSCGKPYFEGNTLRFSISHSADLVVCAVSSIHDIGIDIEYVADIDWETVKSIIDDPDLSRLSANPKEIGSFYHYWVRKEAVLKAMGYGLSIPLRSVELKDEKATIQGACWYLTELYIQSAYVCYVALPVPNVRILTAYGF